MLGKAIDIHAILEWYSPEDLFSSHNSLCHKHMWLMPLVAQVLAHLCWKDVMNEVRRIPHDVENLKLMIDTIYAHLSSKGLPYVHKSKNRYPSQIFANTGVYGAERSIEEYETATLFHMFVFAAIECELAEGYTFAQEVIKERMISRNPRMHARIGNIKTIKHFRIKHYLYNIKGIYKNVALTNSVISCIGVLCLSRYEKTVQKYINDVIEICHFDLLQRETILQWSKRELSFTSE